MLGVGCSRKKRCARRICVLSFATFVHTLVPLEEVISKTNAVPDSGLFSSSAYAPTTAIPSLIATEIPNKSLAAPSSATSFANCVAMDASVPSARTRKTVATHSVAIQRINNRLVVVNVFENLVCSNDIYVTLYSEQKRKIELVPFPAIRHIF